MIRNSYNQAPLLTQDTNGKVTTSHLDITNESQEVQDISYTLRIHLFKSESLKQAHVCDMQEILSYHAHIAFT